MVLAGIGYASGPLDPLRSGACDADRIKRHHRSQRLAQGWHQWHHVAQFSDDRQPILRHRDKFKGLDPIPRIQAPKLIVVRCSFSDALFRGSKPHCDPALHGRPWSPTNRSGR
jgi:hypothetical protein